MHEDLRLGEVVGEEALEDGVEVSPLGGSEFDTEVAGDVPVGKERKFARQQGAVVLGQDAGAARLLQGDEGAVGLAVERRRAGGVGVECGEVSGVAEVGGPLLPTTDPVPRQARTGTRARPVDQSYRSAPGRGTSKAARTSASIFSGVVVGA